MSDSESEWEDDPNEVCTAPIAVKSELTPSSNSCAADASLVKTEAPIEAALSNTDRCKLAVKSRREYLCQLDGYEKEILAALKREMNITASIAAMSSQFNLGGNIDLDKLVAFAPNAEIDKKRRPNVHIRLRNPHCSAQVNPGGFVSILGGRSRSEMYNASRLVAEMVVRSRAFERATVKDFKINNIVMSCKTRLKLRLDEVERELLRQRIDAHSDITVFPCVRVKLEYPRKHSSKIFSTGAFIIMGLTHIADSVVSMKELYELILRLMPHTEMRAEADEGGAGASGDDDANIAPEDDYDELMHPEL